MIKTTQKVYGINKRIDNLLINKLGFNSRLKNVSLDSDQITSLNSYTIKFRSGRFLHEYQTSRIRFLKNTKTYRGFRHRRGLPVRGQRTHTNAKTFKKLRNRPAFF